MKIGISNGIFKGEKNSRLKTLDLASGNVNSSFRTDVVQISLNSNNIGDNGLLDLIAETGKKNKIEIITYIQRINSEKELEKVLPAHLGILKNQEFKKIVFPYSKKVSISLTEKFNEWRIYPYIENSGHCGITDCREEKKYRDFLNCVLDCGEKSMVGASLDIRRFFINESEESIEGVIQKISNTCDILLKECIPFILRVSGIKDFSFQRKDLVSLGCCEDLIPQARILREVLSRQVKLSDCYIMLECSDIDQALQGVNYLKSKVNLIGRN